MMIFHFDANHSQHQTRLGGFFTIWSKCGFSLTPPRACRKVIRAQPRSGERIFPYSTDAIGASFTRACRVLDIADLHFHDLRHHGVSRLFELGWSIPHVAAVSGHRSWASLKRYTHIRQRGDCMAGWRWLDVVTKKPGE